jgi:hypothetical protein
MTKVLCPDLSGVANKGTNAHSMNMKGLNSELCTSFSLTHPEHPEQGYAEILILSTWAFSTYKNMYFKI